METKQKYKMLCPFCKHKEGRFIQTRKEIIKIIDNTKDEIMESDFITTTDEQIVCENCAEEVTEAELFRGEKIKWDTY